MKNNSKSKLIIGLLAVALIATIGGSYAYYATLKGKNVNEIEFTTATFTYTEPQESLKSQLLSDADGIAQDSYYDYTIRGSLVGKTVSGKGYTLTSFVEEKEGNTLDSSNVKVYVTDTNNYPTDEYVGDLDTILVTTPSGSVERLTMTDNGTYKVSTDHGIGGHEGTVEDYILSEAGGSSVIFLQKVNSEEYDPSLDIKRCVRYDGSITEVNMSECATGVYTLEKSKIVLKDLKTINNTLTSFNVYQNQLPLEKTLRLRLWVSTDKYASTPTTSEDGSSVSIGGSGIFKYTVNVGIDEMQGKG